MAAVRLVIDRARFRAVMAEDLGLSGSGLWLSETSSFTKHASTVNQGGYGRVASSGNGLDAVRRHGWSISGLGLRQRQVVFWGDRLRACP